MLHGSRLWQLVQADDGTKTWQPHVREAIPDVTLTGWAASAQSTVTALTVPALTNGTESAITARVTIVGTTTPATGTVVFRAGTATSAPIALANGLATWRHAPAASGAITVHAAFKPSTSAQIASTASRTVAAARKQVTRTFAASGSVSFDAAGNVRADHLYRGYFSSNRGANRSWVWWSNLGIPAAATGITAKVTLTAQHWYYNNGGTLAYGTHGHTSPSAQTLVPGQAGTVTWTAKTGAKEFSVPWTAATTGICLLPAKTQESYAYFAPAGHSDGPRLTLTYWI